MATAATLVLLAHLAWIVLVIFGALFTLGRPFWTAVHILALVWGIIVEAGPWPCPLTLIEEHFEMRAGVAASGNNFLLHSLDRIIYPNLPPWAITVAGVSVCAFNLAIYGRRLWKSRRLAHAVPRSDIRFGGNA
jgi:Protein of Unknown function (DUF2784)